MESILSIDSSIETFIFMSSIAYRVLDNYDSRFLQGVGISGRLSQMWWQKKGKNGTISISYAMTLNLKLVCYNRV